MNKQAVELLKRVREVILAHPEQHDQASFVDVSVENGFLPDKITPDTLPCGTTLCWAGWTALLAYGHLVLSGCYYTIGDDESLVGYAYKMLDLTPEEEGELFFQMDEEKSMEYADYLIEKYGGDA